MGSEIEEATKGKKKGGNVTHFKILFEGEELIPLSFHGGIFIIEGGGKQEKALLHREYPYAFSEFPRAGK